MAKASSRLSIGYTRHNIIRLVHGGKEYFDTLIELIGRAEHSIHLQVYIYDPDETGQMVADALIAAARKGVAVYLLVDGYASQSLSSAFLSPLVEAGIRFRFFEPVLKSSNFYFGRRMHQKVLVVDARYCLVGGINISNKYNDGYGMPPWLDWAMYVEGEAAVELLKVCIDLWTKSARDYRRMFSRTTLPGHHPKEQCPVRVRRNDWVQHRSHITKSYLEMFRDARSHIYIMSSYFLPGNLLRRNLFKAARRGVKVELILAGTSDIKLAKHAERYIYRRLLRNKIRIFEYKKAILHGKMATYDGKWATVGSYNVNNISAFASIELNVDIQQSACVEVIQHELKRIIKNDCEEVTEEEYRTHYHALQRLVQYASYEIIRLMFYLFTFYFKQRKRSVPADAVE